MPKMPATALDEAMKQVHLDAHGYLVSLGANDPARRLPPLTKGDYAYQLARKALIPLATEWAQMWAGRSPASPENTMAHRMEQLAFSNEMQRQAYAAGLIAYDPTKCGHWYREADLLTKQQARARTRQERQEVAA